MECRVRRCRKPVKALGLCAMHYWRQSKYGTTVDRPPRQRTVIPCRIEECDQQARHIGEQLCVLHLTRWRRYGDPLGGGLARGLEREDYFWPKVDKNGPIATPRRLGRCWEWAAGKNRKGYGMLADGNHGSTTAHRFAYELLVGPIPKGLQIDHLCRNHGCVNPAHLEAVTQAENQRRGDTFATRNAAKTHCVNGHRLSPSNSYGYNGRRQCKTCAQERSRRISRGQVDKRREKYQELRKQGYSAKDAALLRSRAAYKRPGQPKPTRPSSQRP